MPAHRLKLRLFLEGVEVPVIAASVQCAPNSPIAASIQIPPLPSGTDIMPRTLVHLFFRELHEGAPSHLAYRGNMARKRPGGMLDSVEQEQGNELLDADYEHERYKLLFGGEVVGFQWTKNAASRSLVLQCQDWSNYWDYAQQWKNTDLFGPGMKAIFSGGSTNLFTDFLAQEGSEIIKAIQTPSVNFPNLKGLLGGIVHLLETIGGSYYTPKKLAGENVFYSVAELRLHVTQMITAYEKDTTAKRLLNADGYDGLFGRTLGNLGSQVSIRKAINALMALIFHETFAIPTPLFVPGTGGSVSGQSRKSARKIPKWAIIPRQADAMLTALWDMKGSAIVNALDHDVLAESILLRLTKIRKACADLARSCSSPEVAQARALFAAAGSAVARAESSARKWKNGASKELVDPFLKAIDDAIAKLQQLADFVIVTRKQDAIPARLNQQIFRPDVWFSAPPRCNVLFPEHYDTLNYQRQFLAEPTRLLLKTNDEFFGEDILFDQFYVTPRSTTVKGGKRLGLSALFAQDILDHELFTGILPVFEKMGELNIFAARSGTINGKKPKIGLAQRTANFLYFKYRFGARQMSVTGRFNPYVVPGFPGLVIDKYVDAAAVQRRAELIKQSGGTNPEFDRLLGTHFLGNFTELSHTVSSDGQGRTDINCGYARQPEEAIEFLGAIREDQTVRKRYPTDALRTTAIAAFNPPAPFSIGPNYGNITRVTEVTEAYASKSIVGGKTLPFFEGPRRKGLGKAPFRVPVGFEAPAGAFGEDVVKHVGGDRSRLLFFRAYHVEEEVPRYKREVVDLPAEEYIRPGWYGDCWHASTIGKVYEQFFATGAITDRQQVADSDGVSSGVQEYGASDALAEAASDLYANGTRVFAPALLALDAESSIQTAVAYLVNVYSYIRQGELDVEDFLHSYTWRPIASMVDMFGTQNLKLSPDGHKVVEGTEGFHSRAFGPYDDLFGLVPPEISEALGIKKGSMAQQRADTRKRKQQAVQAYVSAINFARAILG